MIIAARFQNKQEMITQQLLFTRLFFEIPTQLGSYQQLIVCWVGLLLSFGEIKSRGCLAFLEVKLVGFDLNLIALGVIYNFSHPLPGQFHYCFTQRGVLWDIHNGWQSENNNPRKRAKTESEAGHFMGYKKNKLYYSIQLELILLKNLTKIFWEEQSLRYGDLKIQGWRCKQTAVR